MERENQQLNEQEKKLLASKTIMQCGALISTISLVAITENVAMQQGALASASLLALAAGITLVLEGIRVKK